MHIPRAKQVGFCNNQTCDTCCRPVFKALALKKNQLTRKGLVQTRALKHLIVWPTASDVFVQPCAWKILNWCSNPHSICNKSHCLHCFLCQVKACISNHFYMFFTRDARDRISWSWTTWQRNPSSALGALTGSDCLSNLMSVTPGSAKILKQTDRSEWHTSMESEWTCHIIASPFGQTFSCFVRKLSKSHHNSSQLITTHHNLSHTNSSQLHFSHLTHHSSTAHHNSSQLHFWQVHFSSLLTTSHRSTFHHNSSQLITSQLITLPLLTPHFSHLTYHITTSHHNSSHLITSQLITAPLLTPLLTPHLSHQNSSQLHFSHLTSQVHFSHLTSHTSPKFILSLDT